MKNVRFLQVDLKSLLMMVLFCCLFSAWFAEHRENQKSRKSIRALTRVNRRLADLQQAADKREQAANEVLSQNGLLQWDHKNLERKHKHLIRENMRLVRKTNGLVLENDALVKFIVLNFPHIDRTGT